MSLHKRIETVMLDRRRADPWDDNDLSYAIDTKATGEAFPSGFGIQMQYLATLRVGTTFWANAVEYPIASEAARKALTVAMYSDVLPKLHHLRHLIASKSRDTALQAVLEIIAMMEAP